MSDALSNFDEQRTRAQQLLVDSGAKLLQVFPALAHSMWLMGDWKKDFETFYEFVQADFPKGLSLRWKQFRVLCNGNHDCREMIFRETPAIEGNGKGKNDNIILTNQGTSSDYILGRLHRDGCTDKSKKVLIEKLVDGSIKSIAQAGVLAGYTSARVCVIRTPESFAKKIEQIFTKEQWQTIKTLLKDFEDR